jgi:hypothetical protein
VIDGAAGDAHEDGPPPTPFERIRATESPAPRRRPRGRTAVALLAVAGAGVGLVAGLVLTGALTLPFGGPSGSDAPDERAAPAADGTAGLLALLDDISGSEGTMLAFNDEVADRLQGAVDEEVALAAVAAAASDAAADLVGKRPVIVGRPGGGALDDVRASYLPHLDAWIDYLQALAERPVLLFSGGEQQPYLLLINATAVDFSEALELLLDSEPAPEVRERVERILDDGFRGFGEDAQL